MQRPKRAANEEEEEEEERMHCENQVTSAFWENFGFRKKERERDKRRKEKDLGFEKIIKQN